MMRPLPCSLLVQFDSCTREGSSLYAYAYLEALGV